MTYLPSDEKAFLRAWPSFQAWLIERGSAIHKPTNPYELARFLTAMGIGIVYKNGAGKITHWHNGADEAFRAFRTGKPWRAVERARRGKKTRQEYAALVQRDGDGCMYCGAPLSLDIATIEHVVPISAGGPNHLANKTLACKECNREAGHLSAREKVELAIRKRSAAHRIQGVMDAG